MEAIKQGIENFISSNAENIIAEYDPDIAYASGDQVREENRIYQSISGSNTGNLPSESINIFWMDWEVSNEHAMLDLYEETVTEFSADGIVKFERFSKEVIAIGNFKASLVTIEYLDVNDVVLKTETYDFESLGERVDPYSYIYADFVGEASEVVYKPLDRLGKYIRVTFSKGGASTNCGYLVSSRATDLGATLDKVNFSNSNIRKKNKKRASFQTITDKNNLNNILDFARREEDVPMLFVIDPSENSSHQNMATIARIASSSGTGENMQVNTIAWELTQN